MKERFCPSVSSSLKSKALLISIFHTILTLYADKTIFQDSPFEHILSFLVIKAATLLVLFFWWYGVLLIVCRKSHALRQIALYSLPLFVLMVAWMIYDHPLKLFGDEYNIFSDVITYDLFPRHFTLFTGLVYAISLSLIPLEYGVVLIKIVLQALTCGYCTYRLVKAFGKKGFLTYLIFLLVFYKWLYAHRMHFYGLLFLLLFVKLLMDHYEKKAENNWMILALLLGFSVLSLWRKEGLYLLLTAPAMVCCAYRIPWKKCIPVFAAMFAFTIALYIPNTMNVSFTAEDSHTYITWFVHMAREGLDLSEYPEEVAIIDEYISIDTMNRMNAELGNDNYADNYIVWKEGYIGLRPDVSSDTISAFKSAVIRLIIKEPWIFLKTRVGIYLYSAGTFKLPPSPAAAVITIGRNLHIPMAMILLTFLFSLIKRHWLLFFSTGSLLGHTAITTVFSPAGYFKYYYHCWLCGWFLIVLTVILVLNRIISSKSKV